MLFVTIDRKAKMGVYTLITVSIVEKGRRIDNLMKRMLSDKKISFSDDLEKGDCEYLFLPVDKRGQRDVVLLDEPVFPKCAGEYVTILNADERFSVWPEHSLLITYGLNPLSTVTASSIRMGEEETAFFCCLQRSIATLKGNILEPQEFSVTIPTGELDICEALGFVTLALVFSVFPKEFDSLFSKNNFS